MNIWYKNFTKDFRTRSGAEYGFSRFKNELISGAFVLFALALFTFVRSVSVVFHIYLKLRKFRGRRKI